MIVFIGTVNTDIGKEHSEDFRKHVGARHLSGDEYNYIFQDLRHSRSNCLSYYAEAGPKYFVKKKNGTWSKKEIVREM